MSNHGTVIDNAVVTMTGSEFLDLTRSRDKAVKDAAKANLDLHIEEIKSDALGKVLESSGEQVDDLRLQVIKAQLGLGHLCYGIIWRDCTLPQCAYCKTDNYIITQPDEAPAP